MSTPEPTPTSRRGQIAQTYRMAKRSDPRLGWIILGTFLVGAALGFAGALSGPLVRSSYRAGRLYQQAIEARSAAAV